MKKLLSALFFALVLSLLGAGCTPAAKPGAEAPAAEGGLVIEAISQASADFSDTTLYAKVTAVSGDMVTLCFSSLDEETAAALFKEAGFDHPDVGFVVEDIQGQEEVPPPSPPLPDGEQPLTFNETLGDRMDVPLQTLIDAGITQLLRAGDVIHLEFDGEGKVCGASCYPFHGG